MDSKNNKTSRLSRLFDDEFTILDNTSFSVITVALGCQIDLTRLFIFIYNDCGIALEGSRSSPLWKGRRRQGDCGSRLLPEKSQSLELQPTTQRLGTTKSSYTRRGSVHLDLRVAYFQRHGGKSCQSSLASRVHSNPQAFESRSQTRRRY